VAPVPILASEVGRCFSELRVDVYQSVVDDSKVVVGLGKVFGVDANVFSAPQLLAGGIDELGKLAVALG